MAGMSGLTALATRKGGGSAPCFYASIIYVFFPFMFGILCHARYHATYHASCCAPFNAPYHAPFLRSFLCSLYVQYSISCSMRHIVLQIMLLLMLLPMLHIVLHVMLCSLCSILCSFLSLLLSLLSRSVFKLLHTMLHNMRFQMLLLMLLRTTSNPRPMKTPNLIYEKPMKSPSPPWSIQPNTEQQTKSKIEHCITIGTSRESNPFGDRESNHFGDRELNHCRRTKVRLLEESRLHRFSFPWTLTSYLTQGNDV